MLIFLLPLLFFKLQSYMIDYLTDIRMKHAKDYLRNSKLSLDEIALKVGYLNLSSFIRTFKRTTGETPSNFRKSTRV